MSVLLGTASETEADRVEVWRRQVAFGPWLPEKNAIGVKCQLCGDRIWRNGLVRPGDGLSPSLYRHDLCHNFATGETEL